MRADHEYDDTMLVSLQSVSAGMRSRSVRNPFIYTQLIRLDLSNTISNFTHRYLRPVYRNASKWNKCIIDEYDTMSMSNFAVFEWKGPQVANTVAQRYEIVSGCVASFRGGLFTSSCLCTHAARPRALSPRDERYAPFFLPFVSVFPVE